MGTESTYDLMKRLQMYFVADFGKKLDLTPKRILRSGNRTIVFWADGTKTNVKLSENEQDNAYAAFTAALGIKVYGSNSALKRIVARTETQNVKKCLDDIGEGNRAPYGTEKGLHGKGKTE